MLITEDRIQVLEYSFLSVSVNVGVHDHFKLG